MEKRHSHHQFITLGGTASRPKYTTRHLAALDFLLNIPMQKEVSIRQAGMENASKLQRIEETDGLDTSTMREEEESNREALSLTPTLTVQPSEQEQQETTEAAGKKLQGPMGPLGRFPPSLRYSMQKTTVQSAMYRQWEDQLLDKLRVPGSKDPSILDSRIFFSSARSYPTMVYSIIEFDAKEEKARQQKLKGYDQKAMKVYELPHRDWRGFSYKPLFKQMKEERAGDYFFERGFLYDPNSLDDPNLLYGSHRYVLSRAAKTGPIISSIILYVNKKELKESLNEKFHEKHPNLPASLTLSKIRKVKKDILDFSQQTNINNNANTSNNLNNSSSNKRNQIELTTIAIAIISFERLCLKGLVSKVNRRLTMAVCIILAIKFNETCSQIALKRLIDTYCDYFDKEWDLPKKLIFENEFGVYVHLGFLLHLPYQHIDFIYIRLLKYCNKTSKQYLKEEMLDVYLHDIMMIEKEKEYFINYWKEKEAVVNAANNAMVAAAVVTAGVLAAASVVVGAGGGGEEGENSGKD
eukprot:gene948-1005_t